MPSTCFGYFIIWPIAGRFGRRWSLVDSSIAFKLVAILQVVDSHSISPFYVGRVIGDLCVGAVTVLMPIYAAEMSTKEIGGRLGPCFQVLYAGGVCVPYCETMFTQAWGIAHTSSEVNYAVQLRNLHTINTLGLVLLEVRVAPSTRQ